MTARWLDLPPAQRKAPLIRGLPFEDYVAIDAVHFSTLKAMDISSLHYTRAVKYGRGDTSALRVGRVLHALLLDPEPPDLAIYEGKTRQGAAWKAFEAEHKGQIILRRSELEDAAAMRAALLAHPIAGGLVAEGEGEVTVQFGMLGHNCKGRIDWLRPCGSMVEVKTTRKIKRDLFARDCAALLYHAQIAFYSGGLAAALGREPPELPYLIAVENQPPHDVAVYRVGYDVLEAGQRKIDDWMRRLDECRKTRHWPGVGAEVLDLQLPEYVLNEGLDDVDLSNLGASE